MAQEPEVKPEEKEKLYPASEFKYVVKQRDEAKQTLSQYEKELAELKEFKRTQTEAAAALDLQKQIESGKAKEAIAAAQAAADLKVAEHDRQYLRNLETSLLPEAAKAAVAGVPNLMPTALEDAAALIQSKLAIDPKTLKLYVKNIDGTPMTNNGNIVTPAEYAQLALKDKPHFIASKLVNNTKTPIETQINGQNKTWDQLTREELAKLQVENPALEREMYEAYESERKAKQQKKRDKQMRRELERSSVNIPG
jgi:hypothetical protein